jgi:hypothetical protein
MAVAELGSRHAARAFRPACDDDDDDAGTGEDDDRQ